MDNGRTEVAQIARGWLAGAFVLFFSMAVAAAMPHIAGAVRGAMADAAKNAPRSSDAEVRAAVRPGLLRLREAEPSSKGGHDFVLAPFAVTSFDTADQTIDAAPLDLSLRVFERGFRARAPPLQSA